VKGVGGARSALFWRGNEMKKTSARSARARTRGQTPLVTYVCLTIFKVNLESLYHCTLQLKSHLCIPFLGLAQPQSQFPHSRVCERFTHSQDRSTYFLQQNRQIDHENI
jgi:hypothetical protein